MKAVSIYSIGSCDTTTRIGNYDVLFDHEGRTRRLHRELRDTTVNRCIIQGLIDAVTALKEPCLLTLITSTAIGIAKGSKKKGPNADLVNELLFELGNGGHHFEFEVREGHGEKIRRLITSRPLAAQKSNNS